MEEQFSAMLGAYDESRCMGPVPASITGCRPTLHEIDMPDFHGIEAGVIVTDRKVTRKDTMKVYMREYRRRQKSVLDNLPDSQKEILLEQQRTRVRERVRRHRQRKKLRAEGLSEDEVDRRLRETVPTVQQRRIKQPSLSNCHSNIPSLQQHMGSMDGLIGVSNFNIAPGQDPMSFLQLQQNLPVNNIDFAMGMGMAPLSQQETDPQETVAQQLKKSHPAPESQYLQRPPGSNVEGVAPQFWNAAQVSVFLENLNVENIFKNNIDGRTLLGLTAESLKGVPDHIQVPLLSAIDQLKKYTVGWSE
ncbi:SAM domain-containing protein [Plasmodiophora brassicae]